MAGWKSHYYLSKYADIKISGPAHLEPALQVPYRSQKKPYRAQKNPLEPALQGPYRPQIEAP